MGVNLIRRGVFETNSSSCHSLSVHAGDVYDTIYPDQDGVIVVEEHEFGWDQEIYHYPEARLAYAYIYANEWAGSNTEEFLATLKQVVKEHTGAVDVIHRGKSSSCYSSGMGYIDHQSVECRQLDYLFKDPSQLKDFIFGAGSYIETDNDNH